VEVRQCRYFVAVVDAQSMTGAARKLNVVQSAISRQLANLEAELQTTLLLRSKNGVKPTEAGRVMYLHAQAVIKHIEAAGDTIRSLDREVRGTVSVGIPSSTAAILALPLLTAVRAQLPLVELSIVEGLSGLLSEQLATAKLDLSVLFHDEPLRGFERLPLFIERLHFVSVDPLARKKFGRARSIDFSEVVKWPLVLPSRPNSIRMLLEREALRANRELKVIAELSGVKTIVGAVESGLGSSIMMAANTIAMSPRKAAVFLPISNPIMDRTAWLFQPEHSSLTVAATRVRELVIQLVKSLITDKRWPGARIA